jgi:uncharacterized protein YcnI
VPRLAILPVVAAVLGVLLADGSTALAHIDPDPKQAPAGSTQSVGFTVEHGCDGSPTVQLDMRLPEGVTDAAPDEISGWDGSIEDDVITFVGGPLADDVEGTFSVTMTLPSTPGTTIFFPFVQRCEVGEIRWIGLPDSSGDEPEEPAPAMLLLGSVTTPVEPTTPGEGTLPAESTAPGDSTARPDSTVPSTQPAVPTVPSATTVTTQVPASDDGSNVGSIVFALSIVAVLAVAALAYVRSRSARRPG